MVCRDCGHDSEPGCKFCQKCGLRIEPNRDNRKMKFTSGWIETEDSFMCRECGREYRKGQPFCRCGFFEENE